MPLTAVSSPTAGERHVAVCAFPFTSHPYALFNLASNLATAGPYIQFSFFNSSISNSSILSTKNAHLIPANLRTYDVQDGSLPVGAEPLDHQMLNSFLKLMPENFERGVNAAEVDIGKRVTFFITDGLFSFAVGKMAHDRNVPWVSVWIPAPYSLPSFIHFDFLRQLYDNAEDHDQVGDRTLDIIPGLSSISFAELSLIEFFENDLAKPIVSMFSSIAKSLHQASAIVMNSYQELSPDVLTDYFKSKFQKLLFLGALTPSESSSSAEDVTGCLSWLDEQKPASVAYICFGTAIELPQQEITALAEALEFSGVPFLWSLKDELKDHLPEGFPDRMGSGKVVSWAPQSQVLKHPSIGVYVTHCGYNSVLESISGGVPMICRSFWADNHINAKMVEEVWGIGVRVEGRKITKNGMVKSLEIIFLHDKGKKIRENANNLKQVVLKAAGPDGDVAQDLKTLVQILCDE